jgi:hypothetical protein
MPIDDGIYYLDTDASDIGLGAVLSQIQNNVERPIAYASRTLNAAERNYCTTRKELLAVIYGLKQYRQFLLGKPFVIRTDHSSLQWLRRTPEPMAQQARWLAFIEQFQYTIEHRPGNRHANADSLSRIPCKQCSHCDDKSQDTKAKTLDDEDVSITVRAIVQDLMQRRPDLGRLTSSNMPIHMARGVVTDSAGKGLAQIQLEDPEIGPFVKLRREQEERPSIDRLQLASEITKTFCSQWYRFVVNEGVVYRILFKNNGEPNQLQLLTPIALREKVITESHGGMTGGHMGLSKTCDQVQRRAYWLGWRRDTVRFCRRCDECCRYFRGQLPKNGPLQPIMAGAPFERMSIDLTGPHCRTARGSVYILTCIDAFTKWTEAFPIPNKEAAVVARVLVEQVFCRFGVPIALLSDNGNEVDSSIMREICQLLDIDKLHTTFYKASTNSVLERYHRTLNSMLGKVINEKQTDWDIWLPYVMAAYRSTRHNTTNYSPNFLTLGREVRAPIDIVLGTGAVPDDGVGYDSFVESVRDRMRTAHELVRTHIGEAALRNKRYYDVRVRPAKYQVGQWVYYFNPRRYKGRQDKWSRKYTGPFCVIRVLGPVNVELQQTQRSRPFIVHIDKVKPYHGTPPKTWVQNDSKTPVMDFEPNRDCEIDHDELNMDQSDFPELIRNNEPDTADVITFNTDQEFRRARPKRLIRKPTRFQD